MKLKTVALIGGDARQKYLSEFFSIDFNTVCFGIPQIDNSFKTAEQCVLNADIVVLPIPISRDGKTLNAPHSDLPILLNDIFKNICPKTLVFGGLVNENIADMASRYRVNLIDLLKYEPLTMQNAVLTAEGAVGIAVNESNYAIYGSKCAVCGYGRIGKILTSQLISHGAEVDVYARNITCRSLANIFGANAYSFEEMAQKADKYQFIFNTVPSVVINSEVLNNVSKECSIIELASNPGGIDLEYSKTKELKVISAMSLPGKKSPITAAKLIGTAIYEKIKEENL
jgi:dipicolinate synthase subunit A